MPITIKEDYVQGLEEYHKHLSGVIQDNYGLNIEYMENNAWGLTSSIFYLKCTQGEFTARLGNCTDEKRANMQKDIQLSSFLHLELPTPEYIQNKQNNYITFFKDYKNEERCLRLSKHIVGVAPFEMKYEYLEQCITWMKKMHLHKLPDPKQIDLPYITLDNSPKYLLHGDLTPLNFLVFFEKIDGVIDFETSCIGPVEYDLGKTLLFGWFRMPGSIFTEVLNSGINFYRRATPEFTDQNNRRLEIQEIDINLKLVHHYATEHAAAYLKDIIKYKSSYDDNKKWQKDYEFTKSRLDILLKTKI